MKSLLVLFTSLITIGAFAQETVSTVTAPMPSEESSSKAFSISLFSLGGFADKQFREADPSMDFFDNYLSFNYRINRDFRISARPAFGYSTAGRNIYGDEVTNEIRARDFSLVAKFSNLMDDTLPAAASLATSLRLYLPSSDASRDSGMIARLRWEIEGKYRFLKYSNFRIYAKPSYYFQRSTVFLDNSNPKRPNQVRTTSKIDIEHGAELSFNINKVFAAKPGFEIQEKWSNSSEAENKDEYHSTQIRTGLGLEIRPNRDMSFTVGIQDTRDLIFTSKSPETGYTLMTNISMY
ncbi:MAG: hypothetical protein A2622_00765 [Bdellovibrionales bacterium RIFCSPHIGHO2_01_FULL_40_29]|nr:MAG: hypothetical protein A2622_00765 [Bdellovibrionales bacterium RIFCSPHIGHO2_01_FULL_40_29]OFZ32649.1 MAG: hypothetical protein A3D17_05365 [Bdellovibrionales bacterium RIFCSPHIGHO2_02_FULL_40_15]